MDIQTELTPHRKNIDYIDHQILELIAKRIESAKEIANIKKTYQASICDPEREEYLLKKLQEKSLRLNLPPEDIIKIFQMLIKINHKIEKEQINKTLDNL